jgi:hypothetical protein
MPQVHRLEITVAGSAVHGLRLLLPTDFVLEWIMVEQPDRWKIPESEVGLQVS